MQRTKTYYLIEYNEKERSFQDLADEHGTYPNKIRREVMGFGIKPRDKSAAQSAALKSGRHSHPTKGKERTSEVKQKISRTLSDRWDAQTDEERQSVSDRGKKIWLGLSAEQKEKIIGSARTGLNKSKKGGSKIEVFLQKVLEENGYFPKLHACIEGGDHKIDIVLPHDKVVVDIHGPTHFLPLFGQFDLDKKKAVDNAKITHSLREGYVFIRIISISRSVSELDKHQLESILLRKLSQYKEKFPDEDQRLVQLEIA